MSDILSVALYTNYLAYLLITLSLLFFAAATDRMGLRKIGKCNKKDVLSTSWCLPQCVMVFTRFIAALICLTLLVASYLDEDLSYFRWYSFFNHALLTSFFVLAWLWTCIDCFEPELLETNPRFEYLRVMMWMLFSIQCSTTAVSTVGVWVFAYNTGTTLKRLQMLGLRYIGLHTLNCVFIVFEILFNSIPLSFFGVLWSLVIALLYVASTWFYPVDEVDEEPDWGIFFDSSDKSALIWFNIFLISHFVAYLLAFWISRIKYHLFLKSSWLELASNPRIDEPAVLKSVSSKTDSKRESVLGDFECEYSAELAKDREDYLHHTSWCSMTFPSSYNAESHSVHLSSQSKKRKWSRRKSGINVSGECTSPSPYLSCRSNFDKYIDPGGPGYL